ncbi:hypothetical protein [Akkermansia muciniphila]|nr:hypothetical protein [Akkermansia muciniphila]
MQVMSEVSGYPVNLAGWVAFPGNHQGTVCVDLFDRHAHSIFQ